jgi:GT2 family glycosyltransferase
MPRKLAILITCHNRKEKTLNCLTAVYAQKLPVDVSLAVYLVDDGSTDGTTHAIRSRFPLVTIIPGAGNLFWCGGMQQAWRQAAVDQPDFYLWLNDDTVLLADALATLLSVCVQAEKDPHVPTIVVGSCCDPQTGAHTYGGEKRLGRHPAKVAPIPPASQPLPCDTFNGNIVLVPQSVFARVGVMRAFRHAMGDTDYGYLATRAGCRNLIAPGYLGTCPTNPASSGWQAVNQSRRLRWRKLLGPKGLPPADWWRLLFAHAGWRALYYWPTPYLRVLLGL